MFSVEYKYIKPQYLLPLAAGINFLLITPLGNVCSPINSDEILNAQI